jgi:uncharacterized protein (TIGR03083 family)
MDERFSGSWPDLRPMLRRELEAYLAYAGSLGSDPPTRCPPWTASDVTRHLAATFGRFADMLVRARAGDLSPPFAPEDLAEENLRAVRDLAAVGDPLARLREEATRSFDLSTDPDELMGHQRGVLPVGVQQVFGLADVVIHHDDVAVAAGASYEPPDDVVETLVASYRRLGFWDENDPPVWATFVKDRGT